MNRVCIRRTARPSSPGRSSKPAIEPPYRWRDWSANPQGVTGDELLAFINNEETTRPGSAEGSPALPQNRGFSRKTADLQGKSPICTHPEGVSHRPRPHLARTQTSTDTAQTPAAIAQSGSATTQIPARTGWTAARTDPDSGSHAPGSR